MADGLWSTWRCDKTGNPVGTDTVFIGAPPCDCQGCRADRRVTELLEANNRYQQEARDARAGLKRALTREKDSFFGQGSPLPF